MEKYPDLKHHDEDANKLPNDSYSRQNNEAKQLKNDRDMADKASQKGEATDASCPKPYKRERWDAINELIDKIKKSKQYQTDGEYSTSSDDESGDNNKPLSVAAPKTGSKDSVSALEKSPVYHRKRWEAINEMIRNKEMFEIETQENTLGACSSPFSYIEWDDIAPIVRGILVPYNVSQLLIPKPDLDSLFSCLERTAKVCGGYHNGNEVQYLHYVAPIFTFVSNLFDDNDGIQLLVKETLHGKRVQTSAHFDFLICRGNKRVAVIQAFKEDMEKGLAQGVLGCEVLSDVEQMPVVYCIVTNYSQWIFLRSETDHIYREFAILDTEHWGLPTTKGVQKIAEKIYSILRE
jgi:hypothetical protein